MRHSFLSSLPGFFLCLFLDLSFLPNTALAQTDTVPTLINPRNLSSLNTAAHESGAELTADELTIYFSSNRTGRAGIYVAQRASKDEPFGEPVALDPLNTVDNNEGAPSISTDGLTIYFYRSYGPLFVDADIYVATRTSVSLPFNEPVQIPTLQNKTGYFSFPEINPAGTELLFRWHPYGLYRVLVSGPTSYSEPTEITEIGSGGRSPSLSADGQTMYFGLENAPVEDRGLWVCTRAADLPGVPFTNLTKIAQEYGVQDCGVATDPTVIYFSADIPGGKGQGDIWTGDVIPLPVNQTTVNDWDRYR
jgi:Tol biopolymer transport system component